MRPIGWGHMKSCSTCGSTWDDFVDFCFADGTPLVRAAGALVDAMDAPLPPRRLLQTPPPAPRIEDLSDDAVEVDEEQPDEDEVGAGVVDGPTTDRHGESAPRAPHRDADEDGGAIVRPASILFGSALVMSALAAFVVLVLVVWLTRDIWSPNSVVTPRPTVTAVAPVPQPQPPAPTPVEIEPVPPEPIEPVEVVAPVPVPAPATAAPVPRPPSPRPDPAPAVQPAPASKPVAVRLESWPPGAEVKVAGKARGKTPLTVELPAGNYPVTFSLVGYKPWTGEVDAQGTAVSIPPVSLEIIESEVVEGDVMVFFAGRLGDALTVDGRDVGPLPVQVRLSRGEHSFLVTGPGGVFQVTRDVRSDPAKLIQLHLDR